MRSNRINPTLILTIALPLFAVVASVGTAVTAFSRGDPPLPDQYHWEGDKLDHDFAQSTRASQLHFAAVLELLPRTGMCHLTLRLDGPAPPAIDVSLIHVSNPALDRHMRFTRLATDYAAPCTELPVARWHIDVSDPGGSWSFRTSATGGLKSLTLSSGSAADNSTWP